MKKTQKILALLLTLALTVSLFTFTSGAIESQEEWLEKNWSEIVESKGSLLMTPGEDNTKMNFSWQSSFKSAKAEIEVATKQDMSDAESLDVSTRFNIFCFEYTHEATASELEADTTYYYKYYADKKWSDVYSFKTADAGSTRVLFVSDCQIGRYRQGTDEEILQHDTYGWYKTMELATEKNAGINFIISTGDQVEDSYSEHQYSLMESVPQLRNYPIAAAVGNHEFYTTNYSSHYNNPNRNTDVPFRDPAGNGYYFLYNDILFIVLDSNVVVPSTHRKIIKAACEAYPNAKWKVVSMHHSPYDANAAKYFTSKITRATITPFFDEFGIDLCLSGHDHYYSRSYIVKNNKVTDDVLHNNTYTDPKGTLYVSANSSSGSNYNGIDTENVGPECDVWFQSDTPCYSIMDVKDGKLTVTTYETGNNDVVDTISIIKNNADNKRGLPFSSAVPALFS